MSDTLPNCTLSDLRKEYRVWHTWTVNRHGRPFEVESVGDDCEFWTCVKLFR
jgi:hypothetical protein